MTEHKVALVTGSGKRRIGRFVAEALAARGYALAIHYHTSRADALEAVASFVTNGTEAIAVHADLGDVPAVRGMIDATLERFDRLDVLVNCAADWGSKKLEEVTADDLRHFFAVNTLGTFIASQHAGLTMAKQPEGGSIITLGDWATERPYLDHTPYLIAKGAIPTLTRCLAAELSARNPSVRVNCIMPGPVMLPLDMPKEERQIAIDATLVKREGRPENIAQAVLYLIDNDFATGSCLTVDGGRTVYSV